MERIHGIIEKRNLQKKNKNRSNCLVMRRKLQRKENKMTKEEKEINPMEVTLKHIVTFCHVRL